MCHKFNFITSNPPYDGSLHLSIFRQLLDCMAEGGRITVVEPSQWLIDLRRPGFGILKKNYNLYAEMKNMLEGHVRSVYIDNLNNEFHIANFTPLSVVEVDFSKNYDRIDFTCCGEKKVVKSIWDCNLIGNYDVVWSIFNKVLSYGDMMEKHITNKPIDDACYYSKYTVLNPRIGCYDERHERDSVDIYGFLPDNGIFKGYVSMAYTMSILSAHEVNDIYAEMPKSLKIGSNWDRPVFSDKNCDCVYGTREELENWQHFNLHNQLPKFINIALSIDQGNNSLKFLPWIVDDTYSDSELNEKFGFTDEEIKLIDYTIRKYGKESPWFNRYMHGRLDEV